MGLAENAFQKILGAILNKKDVDIRDHLKLSARRLELLAALCLKPTFSPNALSSRKFVGLDRTSLYLPDLSKIVTSETEFFKIQTHLILQIAAAHNLAIRNSNRATDIDSRVETIKKLPLINNYLDQNFAGYRLLQSEVLEIAKRYVPKDRRYASLYSFWLAHFLCRSRIPDSEQNLASFKINEMTPDFLRISTCCVEIADVATLPHFASNPTTRKTREPNDLTELARKHSTPTQKVDFEKMQNNPIYHSFEKTETAEEYQGGRRIDSGSDELKDHSAALEELDLSHVTTGGESAQSIYRTEGETSGTVVVDDTNNEFKTSFVYPEWNSRTHRYLRDHCSLYELPSLPKDLKASFRTKVEQDFSVELETGRSKIATMVNEPAWQNRLKEGDEIDFDSFARDYFSLQHKKQVTGKWYAQKKKLVRDATIYIVFDQSLSSDSWVENRRVLDLFIEAISIAGILFEDLLPRTQVVGAWSATRHQCTVQTFKTFTEPWDDFFARIHHIEPQGYTRLGPAIRHATHALKNELSRNKLLLLLTDGKPTDLDGYEGSHGINDIRQACLEAEKAGVMPIALTVDHSGKNLFPKMFRRYKILSHAKQLPVELLGILSQLLGKSK